MSRGFRNNPADNKTFLNITFTNINFLNYQIAAKNHKK